MVKAYSTEMCFRVFDRCMQVHGGMGLTNEMNLVEGWHQARIVRVADGTGEVMRRNIVSRILKGDLQF
jgi:acyl-CoA dehydrogenase